MLRTLAAITLALSLSAALSPSPASGEDELLAADRAFAAAAAADGIDGWMSFMAEDAARMQVFGGEMIAGAVAIRDAERALLESPDVLLRWDPAHAHAFDDGSHGITTGTYQVVSRADQRLLGSGRYLTFWRRTDDGWKVIFDTGVGDAD